MSIRLIVGLGNPGPEYEQTRHNAGFWVVDNLAGSTRLARETRFNALAAKTSVAGQEVWLLEPQTYMNRSGQSVGALARFYKTLQEVDNLTMYTFQYNILSPDSIEKSKNIWCSANPSKAWSDWMLNGKAAPHAPASCNPPHEKVLALGQKMKVTGTPTIIFADGSRIPGAIDAKGLEEKFGTLK